MWPTTMARIEKYQMKTGDRMPMLIMASAVPKRSQPQPKGSDAKHDEPLAVDEQESEEVGEVVGQGNGQEREREPAQQLAGVRFGLAG